jgi:phosphate starvation-inducible PhoH-like protein
MKMFLTRIGFGSKVVITGDKSQKDLAPGAKSGLDVALRVLKNVDEIAVCELTAKDVVRHPLVQKIVNAYEDYEHMQAQKEKKKAVKSDKLRGNKHE